MLLKGIVAATGLVCFLLFAGIMSGRPKTPVLPAGSGSPTLQTDLSGTIAEIGKQIIVEQTAATPEEAEKLLQNAAEEDDENEQGENIEALVEEFRTQQYPVVPPQNDPFVAELLDMSKFLAYLDESREALESDKELVYVPESRYRVSVQDGEKFYESEVRTGDRASLILSEWLDAKSAANAIEVAKKVYGLDKIAIGRAFSVISDEESGAFRRFVYDINSKEQLTLSLKEGRFEAVREKKPLETRLVFVKGDVEGSLQASAKKAGENVNFAANFARLFSGRFNFSADARKGDTFFALVEKNYVRGEFSGYGAILAARYVSGKKRLEAYYLKDTSGTWQYYNEKGDTQKSVLLSAPLAHLRVTSGYSMNRKHPILRVVRPHQGVDYGAPRGTPVMSVGDGKVIFAGFKGGFGKTIIIKHSSNTESQYAHLNGYAQGIKQGGYVRQGQTIGYVGSTGTATGPHLDFRIRQNGKYVNPEKVITVSGNPLSKQNKATLAQLKKKADAVFDGKAKAPEKYARSEWTR
ncbi:MAG: M23 family metallopeptidase [Mailhella sp.]|nr:M23 family metallopeptidase [Mailhella sp.]